MENYLQNLNSSLPKCNDVGTYESSTYKFYKGHRLVTRVTSDFKPLTSFLNEYVDELLDKHNQYFLDDADFIRNFDQLGKLVFIFVLACLMLYDFKKWKYMK